MKICFRCKKDNVEFGANKRKKDGLQSYCKICTKEVDKDFYLRHKERVKPVKMLASNEKYKEHKLKTDKIKEENPCKDCNSFYHPSQMQFDHLLDKDKNVSDMLRYRWETIEKEIAKCDLVCANCHCLRTFNRRII